MEVLYWKKVLFPSFKPFLFPEELTFWAVSVSTGIIGYAYMSAVVALIHMAAEFCRSAYLDCMHSPQLITGHGMDLSVLRAVLPEDIGDFDPAAVPHRCRSLELRPGCVFDRQIQWACDL